MHLTLPIYQKSIVVQLVTFKPFTFAPRVRFPAMEFFWNFSFSLIYEDARDDIAYYLFPFIWIPTIAQLVERRTVVVNRIPQVTGSNPVGRILFFSSLHQFFLMCFLFLFTQLSIVVQLVTYKPFTFVPRVRFPAMEFFLPISLSTLDTIYFFIFIIYIYYYYYLLLILSDYTIFISIYLLLLYVGPHGYRF